MPTTNLGSPSAQWSEPSAALIIPRLQTLIAKKVTTNGLTHWIFVVSGTPDGAFVQAS